MYVLPKYFAPNTEACVCHNQDLCLATLIHRDTDGGAAWARLVEHAAHVSNLARLHFFSLNSAPGVEHSVVFRLKTLLFYLSRALYW